MAANFPSLSLRYVLSKVYTRCVVSESVLPIHSVYCSLLYPHFVPFQVIPAIPRYAVTLPWPIEQLAHCQRGSPNLLLCAVTAAGSDGRSPRAFLLSAADGTVLTEVALPVPGPPLRGLAAAADFDVTESASASSKCSSYMQQGL